MSVALAFPSPYTDTVPLKRSVLHALAYADVFDYPLSAAEVYRYLPVHGASLDAVVEALGHMTAEGTVLCSGQLYVMPGREALMETRQRRSRVANALWRKALRYGRIVASLPFVRMVAITGSLAVNNTEPGTDIDLILVCTPGRLWTSRALVLLLARLAKLDGANLCPNYMVTTNALEFCERSLYVAHEVAQMIPLSGWDLYDRIRSMNAWTDDYLPNAHGAPQGTPVMEYARRIPSLLETALAVPSVSWFEAWEMRRKIRRLSREQSLSPEAYFSADVCKGHADMHGQHTEALLRQRLNGLEMP